MFALINMLEKVGIHDININALERDDEMWREPALGLDGDHRGELARDVFEQACKQADPQVSASASDCAA